MASQDFLPFGLDSTATFVLSIAAAALVLSITFTKIWVSRIQRLHFLLSDYFALVSALTLVASLGLIIYYISIPMQEQYMAEPLNQSEDGLQTAYLKAVYAIELLWPISLAFSKLSILLLFRRVFFSTSLRVVSVFSMIYIVMLYLAMVFGSAFQCNPVDSFWHGDSGGKEPICINRQVFFLFSGIPNIFINIIILVLPIYQIIRCEYRITVKIFLWSIFLLGSLAVAASIVRFVEVAQIGGMDSKQARIGGGAAVIVEATITVLCAYLPTLCPALWKMRPSFGNGSPDEKPKKSLRQRIKGSRNSDDSHYTGGRTWPRPRPQSEFVDPNKSLPSEPSNDYNRSMGSLSSNRPQDTVLGGIQVDKTITTTVERRSQFYEQHPGVKVQTSFGTMIDGPDTMV